MDNVANNKPVVKSHDVIGVKVINNAKEDLGQIYEIVLNKVSGQVEYVVLETGTFLGMCGKFLALPWKTLKYDVNSDSFIVNVDKNMLEDAPGFDKDNWPTFSDEKWAGSIANYYSLF